MLPRAPLPSPMITASLVTIASVNFELVVDFYTNFLEAKPDRYIPAVYAEFSIAGLRLGIFQPKANHQDEFKDLSQSSMSLCLEVDDLERSIAKLTQLGYAPTGQIITASHGREIYAYDPDGNRLILHSSS